MAKQERKYSFKKVRATEPGWDGFHLRDDGDVFTIRVYEGVEPAKWYEVLGEADAVDGAQLKVLLADPMRAVPETQRPPDEKEVRRSAKQAPAAQATYDGSVL